MKDLKKFNSKATVAAMARLETKADLTFDGIRRTELEPDMGMARRRIGL